MIKKVDTIIDGHKFHLHPNKEALWIGLGDCYPIHIEIGATSRCNQKCVFCALDFVENRRTDIDRDVMIKALKDMGNPKIKYSMILKYGNKTKTYEDRVKSVMFGGEGEPTLHKDLELFIEESKMAGLDCALTTNGVLFDGNKQKRCLPHLSWIKFSVDAGTPETYSQVHGVPKKQFQTLIENISSSVRLKKENGLDVIIGTQYLVIPQNTNKRDVMIIIGMLREIKSDYLVIKPYSDHPRNQKDLIVGNEDYKKLENLLGNLKSIGGFNIFFREETIKRVQQEKKYAECYGLPFISLIDSKGNVLPCNLFYDKEEFTYGNLYNNDFSDIWAGAKRKEIITKLRAIGVKDCRRGCRCDAGNQYLDRLKNPQPHDNFS